MEYVVENFQEEWGQFHLYLCCWQVNGPTVGKLYTQNQLKTYTYNLVKVIQRQINSHSHPPPFSFSFRKRYDFLIASGGGGSSTLERASDGEGNKSPRASSKSIVESRDANKMSGKSNLLLSNRKEEKEKIEGEIEGILRKFWIKFLGINSEDCARKVPACSPCSLEAGSLGDPQVY
jgi:hypothetical protein